MLSWRGGTEKLKIRKKGNLEKQDAHSTDEDDKNIKPGILNFKSIQMPEKQNSVRSCGEI